MCRLSIAVVVAVSTVAFTQIASAADMPLRAPIAPSLIAAPSWTGWYVGLNAGGGWGNNSGINNSVTSTFCNPLLGGCIGIPASSNAAAASVPGAFDTKLSGFIGGGQIGYNYQMGQTVWGIEADFQGAALKGSANSVGPAAVPAGFPVNTVTVAGTGSQKLDFLGTLRGRLGWTPNSPWLVYVTGGLAYGRTETSASFNEQVGGPCFCGPNPASTASSNKWRAGWTVGGGFEWMFAPRWSLKGEYLYYDLGSVTVNNSITQLNGAAVPFFGVGIASEANYRGSIARAGVNYHF